MSNCNPTFPPVEPSSRPGEKPAVLGCLVKESNAARAPLTARRDTDARTALNLGLANYIRSLPPFTHPVHGRIVQLKKVFHYWPDQEEKVDYPSAIVHSTLQHTYSSSGLTPQIPQDCKLDATTWLVKYSELEMDITIDILATDPEERIALAMQMEDALNPVDWMQGFNVTLPHYHNLRARYLLTEGHHPDNETDAFERNRHLQFVLSGSVPLVRAKKYAPLQEARVTVEVTDGNETC